jgi:hypothetical protein
LRCRTVIAGLNESLIPFFERVYKRRFRKNSPGPSFLKRGGRGRYTVNTNLMGYRKVFWAGFTLILFMSLGGCRAINIGGSGNIGGVHGSGGINIPVPQR